MISFRLARLALTILGGAILCGCLPSRPGQSGEENEAHFKAGRARVNAMDFLGAIAAFEKALEANPHSAAAHFELGWLLADKEPNPAAAIYHYEQFLRLRPNAENAETIKQHILRLKQDLAKAVLPLPATPAVQRELEQLAEENRRLRDEVQKWRAHYASQGTAVSPTADTLGGGSGGAGSRSQGAAVSDARPGPGSDRPGGGHSPRFHKVQAGETPSAIARKYGVELKALMAANPGLNPNRMRVGQTLNIPAH